MLCVFSIICLESEPALPDLPKIHHWSDRVSKRFWNDSRLSMIHSDSWLTLNRSHRFLIGYLIKTKRALHEVIFPCKAFRKLNCQRVRRNSNDGHMRCNEGELVTHISYKWDSRQLRFLRKRLTPSVSQDTGTLDSSSLTPPHARCVCVCVSHGHKNDTRITDATFTTIPLLTITISTHDDEQQL